MEQLISLAETIAVWVGIFMAIEVLLTIAFLIYIFLDIRRNKL